jgi:hypothetical protein
MREVRYMERENDKTVMGIEDSAPMKPVIQMEKSSLYGDKVTEAKPPASFTIRKRIKSTAYEVIVHFSQFSKETLNDKILRMARNEVLNGLNEPNGKDGQR